MQRNGVRHIVWDWNGTLLADAPACVAALNRMLARRGMPAVDEEQYRREFGFPVQDYYRKLGFDFEREDWDENAREFHENYAECSRTAPLRPGALGALERLHALGMPMSVLSASEIGLLRHALAQRDVLRFFDRVKGLSDLYASSKLNVGRDLLADLALPPDAVLLVGDTTHDYEVARELACRCVLVTGGHQAGDRLAGCGCRVLTEVTQVPALFGTSGSST
jgi:phosphoglycolate phosphatase